MPARLSFRYVIPYKTRLRRRPAGQDAMSRALRMGSSCDCVNTDYEVRPELPEADESVAISKNFDSRASKPARKVLAWPYSMRA